MSAVFLLHQPDGQDAGFSAMQMALLLEACCQQLQYCTSAVVTIIPRQMLKNRSAYGKNLTFACKPSAHSQFQFHTIRAKFYISPTAASNPQAFAYNLTTASSNVCIVLPALGTLSKQESPASAWYSYLMFAFMAFI